MFGENPEVSCIRNSRICKCILILTVFYRLRICSVEKFLYCEPRLTAIAGFFVGGVCFVKRALKKQSLHHKKDWLLF